MCFGNYKIPINLRKTILFSTYHINKHLESDLHVVVPKVMSNEILILTGVNLISPKDTNDYPLEPWPKSINRKENRLRPRLREVDSMGFATKMSAWGIIWGERRSRAKTVQLSLNQNVMVTPNQDCLQSRINFFWCLRQNIVWYFLLSRKTVAVLSEQ